ncbi:MAG: serine/threonine protein kinase, partial [Planctomycetota bacterium]
MGTPLECPGCRWHFKIENTDQSGTVTCGRCHRVIVVHSAERRESFNLELMRALVAKQYVTEAQVQSVMGEASGAGAASSLSHLLVERNLVSPAQIRRALDVEGEMPLLQLPGYEVFGQIGRGGMGAVYRGVHRGCGKMVAIKVLSARLCRHKAFLERFHREARVAIELDHPNIVKGFDEGEWDGYHYFVMEMVEGKSANRVLAKRGHFGELRSFHIARQVANALTYAHARGLIHRDIKPDNILLMRDGTAKLVDYGLVKMADDDTLVNLTADGQIMGTPHYISPEQARGGEEIDIRSDIYSLGATLYHMATGSTPFVGEVGAEIISLHLYGQLRDPREVQPELSAQAASVILKMMARNRDERYRDPAELQDSIDHYFRTRRSGEEAGEDPTLFEEGLEGEGMEITPVHELFTTPAAAPMHRPPLWWSGRLVGVAIMVLLAVVCLLVVTTPRAALPDPVAGVTSLSPADIALGSALARPLSERCAALEAVKEEYPKSRAAGEAEAFLSIWRRGEGYVGAAEIEAAGLERRLATASPKVRTDLLRSLSRRYGSTPSGRRATQELATEQARVEATAKRRAEEQRRREEAERRATVLAERLKREATAKAALAKIRGDGKRPKRDEVADLNRFLKKSGYQKTQAAEQAEKRLKVLSQALARERQWRASRRAYDTMRSRYLKLFGRGEYRQAAKVAAEYREGDWDRALRTRATPMIKDCEILQARAGLLLKGMESLIDSKVMLRMERGDVLIGRLTGVSHGREPGFTLFKTSSRKELTRFVDKLSAEEKVRIAALGAKAESGEGGYLLFRALMALRAKRWEEAADLFRSASEDEPAKSHHLSLLK